MNPLDQLADITMPKAVSFWPLAWGYWVLISFLLALSIWAIIGVVRYRKHRKAKYEALNALAKLHDSISHNIEDAEFAHKVQVIVKSLCMHYLPETVSKTLHGSKWQSFLLKIYKGKDPASIEQAITAINNRMYTKPSGQNSSAQQGFESPTSAQDIADNSLLSSENTQIIAAMNDLVKTSFPCKSTSISASTVNTHLSEPEHV